MKVSIITPIYNSEKFIEKTIQSVIDQTYSNWELILVDDCSSDRSRELVEKYTYIDDRIKYINLEVNSGAAIARNTGLKKATGRFVAFLDSDDIWEKEKLDIQVKFMMENDYGFTFTSYKIIDEVGYESNKIVKAPEVITYNELLKNTIIGCLTVMIDRNKVGDIYMPNIRTRQDFATWLKILKSGYNAYGIDIPLASYRVVKGSISSNKFKAMKRNWYVYRKIEKLSLLRSSYVFFGYIFNAIKKRI